MPDAVSHLAVSTNISPGETVSLIQCSDVLLFLTCSLESIRPSPYLAGPCLPFPEFLIDPFAHTRPSRFVVCPSSFQFGRRGTPEAWICCQELVTLSALVYSLAADDDHRVGFRRHRRCLSWIHSNPEGVRKPVPVPEAVRPGQQQPIIHFPFPCIIPTLHLFACKLAIWHPRRSVSASHLGREVGVFTF